LALALALAMALALALAMALAMALALATGRRAHHTPARLNYFLLCSMKRQKTIIFNSVAGYFISKFLVYP